MSSNSSETTSSPNEPTAIPQYLWKKDGESVLDDLIKAQVYLKKLIEIRSHQ